MSWYEGLLAIAIVGITIGFTISFLREGVANRWFSYLFMGIALGTMFFGKVLAREVFIVACICIAIWAFLNATNIFERCTTEEDFRRIYQSNYVLLLMAVYLGLSLGNAARNPTTETIICFVIVVVQAVSFSKLISFPRGSSLFYEVTLGLQIALLAALWLAIAANYLYDLVDGKIVWRLFEEKKINFKGIDQTCDVMITKFGYLLISSYMYFILGMLHHGWIPKTARKLALKAHTILLLFMVYQSIPESRQILQEAPIVGNYVASPTIMLVALVVAALLVITSRATASERS